ncbi:MAG TPA: phosphate signaling complex protein PhoU [Lacipirellulaceae bacterium]|nr:phosphate signaling complex protein PhoU [Lacipirellulaceae bacterium]
MSIHLQRDLEALEQNLLSQSSLVEQMVFRAVQSLRELRVEIAQEVIASEETVNYREVEIEEECLKILALHQPVAVDLRRVATVLKINGDLERIADLAVNISERTHSLVLHPEFQMPEHLDQMVEAALMMVRDALDAFVRLDVNAAREVCLRDDAVDELNRQLISDLHDLVQDNPNCIEAAFHFYSASRHVERIADHATNISEDVIYLVDGEIARHRHDGIAF